MLDEEKRRTYCSFMLVGNRLSPIIDDPKAFGSKPSCSSRRDLSFETLAVTRTGVCLFNTHVKVDRSLLFVMNLRRSQVICLRSEVILLVCFEFFARTSEGGRHSGFNQVYHIAF